MMRAFSKVFEIPSDKGYDLRVNCQKDRLQFQIDLLTVLKQHIELRTSQGMSFDSKQEDFRNLDYIAKWLNIKPSI